MPACLLSVTLQELSVWQRLGVLRVLGVRLIPVVLNGEVPIIDAETEAAIRERMPDYEEDFEVLHTMVDLDPSQALFTARVLGWQVSAVEIGVESVRRLFAISKRGLALLKGKVGPDTRVEGVLASTVAERRDKERASQMTLHGATAAVRLLDAEEPPHEVQSWLLEISRGHEAREKGAEWPIAGGSFIENLMSYDRREPKIDRLSDVGFVQDVAFVCGRLTPIDERPTASPGVRDGDGLRSAAKRLWGRLAEAKEDGGASLCGLLHRHRRELEDLEQFVDGSTIAAVVFLKLRKACESGTKEDVHRARRVVSELRQAGFGREASIGAWLTGAFYGFKHFADSYHEYLSTRRSLAPAAGPAIPSPPTPPSSTPKEEPKAPPAASGIHAEPSARHVPAPAEIALPTEEPEAQAGTSAKQAEPPALPVPGPAEIAPPTEELTALPDTPIGDAQPPATAPSEPPAAVRTASTEATVDDERTPAVVPPELTEGSPVQGQVPASSDQPQPTKKSSGKGKAASKTRGKGRGKPDTGGDLLYQTEPDS